MIPANKRMIAKIKPMNAAKIPPPAPGPIYALKLNDANNKIQHKIFILLFITSIIIDYFSHSIYFIFFVKYSRPMNSISIIV